jgi:hypothetical protein
MRQDDRPAAAEVFKNARFDAYKKIRKTWEINPVVGRTMTKMTIKKNRQKSKATLEERVDILYNHFQTQAHSNHIGRASCIQEGNLEAALKYQHRMETLDRVVAAMDYVLAHGKVKYKECL